MANINPARDVLLAVQQDMFRKAEHEYGLNLKLLSKATGIGADTIKTWRNGVAMPAWALAVLSQAMPDDLISLMFTPFDKVVVTTEPGDGDIDKLARESAEYNVEYLGARDPRGDGGERITPREKRNLQDRARRMASTARRAAA